MSESTPSIIVSLPAAKKGGETFLTSKGGEGSEEGCSGWGEGFGQFNYV